MCWKKQVFRIFHFLKKYSAIPMWENINKEVEKEYPDLLELAKERLMSAAIFSLYEAKIVDTKIRFILHI